MKTQLRAHPAADVFPMMSDSALAALALDMEKNGQVAPITLVQVDGETLILDGRNRYEACRRAKIEPLTAMYAGEDPIAFVWSSNAERRHLNESQMAMIAESIATLKNGTNQFKTLGKEGPQACGPSSAHPKRQESASVEYAAKLVGVSPRLVTNARRVKTRGVPELASLVTSGQVRVTAASAVAGLPADEQKRLVAQGPKAISALGNAIQNGRAPNPATRALAPVKRPPARKGVARRGIAEGSIENLKATASLWGSWARDISEKWPGITAEERQQLREQLGACRASANQLIKALEK